MAVGFLGSSFEFWWLIPISYFCLKNLYPLHLMVKAEAYWKDLSVQLPYTLGSYFGGYVLVKT